MGHGGRENAMGIYCKTCESPVREDDTHCPECGAALRPDPVQVPRLARDARQQHALGSERNPLRAWLSAGEWIMAGFWIACGFLLFSIFAAILSLALLAILAALGLTAYAP